MGNLVKAQATPVANKRRRRNPAIPDLHLGGEMFAIGILNVKEIIEYGKLTEMPMMPAFIRGVINLRGAVVPVIDLSARFGGAAERGAAAHLHRHRRGDAGRRQARHRHHGRCGQRGAGNPGWRHRAAALLRRPDPRRLHRRHGQGQSASSSSSSKSSACCRWMKWPFWPTSKPAPRPLKTVPDDRDAPPAGRCGWGCPSSRTTRPGHLPQIPPKVATCSPISPSRPA